MPGADGGPPCSKVPSCGAGQGDQDAPSRAGLVQEGFGYFFCLFLPFSPSLHSALSTAKLQRPQMPVCEAQAHAQTQSEESSVLLVGRVPSPPHHFPLHLLCLTRF